VGKIAKKQSVGVYFDNMALYFECWINKNARENHQALTSAHAKQPYIRNVLL